MAIPCFENIGNFPVADYLFKILHKFKTPLSLLAYFNFRNRRTFVSIESGTMSALKDVSKTIPSRLSTKISESNQKYRGMFEPQKPGNKTSSGEIGLDIRTHASTKVGQDQVSGGVSVLCWHAAPVANVLWKPPTMR